MRVLITGGFGFVGSRLAVLLAKSGHDIILGSRGKSQIPEWLPMAQIVHINWEHVSELEHICKNIDVVVHTAGMNAQECSIRPSDGLISNGVLTARLVESASLAQIRNFVYVSTAHVYASPLVGIITEQVCPKNLHPYASTHLAAEAAVLHAQALGEINGLVLRLSNSFGVPAHKDVDCWRLLVNDLCRQAVTTRKLLLHTSGTQERDFICLTDVCRIVEFLIYEMREHMPNGIMNLGRGTSWSVIDMALLIKKRCEYVFGFSPPVLYPKKCPSDVYEKLEYRIDRFNKLGLSLNNHNDISEIDDLLCYCQRTFG